RDDALRAVDEIEAAAAQLVWQCLDVALDPEDRRPPLACRVERLRRGVDRRDDRTELGELRRALARARVEVQHLLSLESPAERRPYDRGEPGPHTRPAVPLVERAAVVVGRLHQARSEKPPSTTIVWPHSIFASSETRNDTEPATSPGST